MWKDIVFASLHSFFHVSEPDNITDKTKLSEVCTSDILVIKFFLVTV